MFHSLANLQSGNRVSCLCLRCVRCVRCVRAGGRIWLSEHAFVPAAVPAAAAAPGSSSCRKVTIIYRVFEILRLFFSCANISYQFLSSQ